jgi:stage II sporulation protein D
MKLLKLKSHITRFSAIMLLIIIIWGCGRVPSLTEVEPPSSRLPFVKVLLDIGSRQHTIGLAGNGQMAIDCYKGDKRVSYYSNKSVIISGEKQKLGLYDRAGHNLDYNIDHIIVSPRGNKEYLTFDDKPYRGLMRLESSSGQVKLVNIVYVEDYLKGVVPLEIGPTPEEQIEAVRAQAVAARTYSMSHLGQYGDEEGYDLKADITDQIYAGVEVENEEFNEAIESTRGMVAVYGDRMIDAYYHSTCGGMTDDIEDVWNKDSKPYLRAIGDDEACNISKYFTWEERFGAEQLILRLERYISQSRGNEINIGKLTDISISNRTPGGRVASVIFETNSGHFIFTKEEVRWVVRRSDNLDAILRSANFTLDIRRDQKGDITHVIFQGRGYGHGVGMCQMGAKGLAAKGIGYDSILSLYYQGTELKKLY